MYVLAVSQIGNFVVIYSEEFQFVMVPVLNAVCVTYIRYFMPVCVSKYLFFVPACEYCLTYRSCDFHEAMQFHSYQTPSYLKINFFTLKLCCM